MLDNNATSRSAGNGDGSDDLTPETAEKSGEIRSLTDDIMDLVDDGKTYAEAEMAFQKTRLAFAADRGKGVLLFGIGALIFVQLALVALTVGAVIALTPTLTAWGATGVVTVALLICAALMGLAVKRRASAVSNAFADDKNGAAK